MKVGNWYLKECIAAIATALAPSGLGVVRLSGKGSIKIATRFFKPNKSFKRLEDLKGYEATYGKIYNDDYVLDDVVILVFRAPKSYTGEDVVEISCHGGILILKTILKLCFKNGAVAATKGEFTKRAFLNNKLTLMQAEAVLDVINADSLNFLKAANALKEGSLTKHLDRITKYLIEIDSDIVVNLDYPQHETVNIDMKKLKLRVESKKKELEKIYINSVENSFLKDGVNVLIVGRPNVGKSTIMNILSGEEKSIVADIDGTTRDIVESTIYINGIKFNLYDTAGICETENIVEQMGILKAKEKLKQADIVLLVTDDGFKKDDLQIISNSKHSKKILVYNKSDLGYNPDESFGKGFSYILRTTKEDERTINEIKDLLYSLKKDHDVGNNEMPLVLNERQIRSIKLAISHLVRFTDAVQKEMPLDILGVILEEAIDELLKLSGKNVSEIVIGEVFSRFCVGK